MDFAQGREALLEACVLGALDVLHADGLGVGRLVVGLEGGREGVAEGADLAGDAVGETAHLGGDFLAEELCRVAGFATRAGERVDHQALEALLAAIELCNGRSVGLRGAIAFSGLGADAAERNDGDDQTEEREPGSGRKQREIEGKWGHKAQVYDHAATQNI